MRQAELPGTSLEMSGQQDLGQVAEDDKDKLPLCLCETWTLECLNSISGHHLSSV
jgi:hypothetical protein